MSAMNRYGRLAMRHWRKHDPERYARIQDPEDFFSTLGQQVESSIQELATHLAGPDPPEEGYLEKVGRLNMARLQAEEQVLSEMVLIPSPADQGTDDPRP
jgi:hypothetical protein